MLRSREYWGAKAPKSVKYMSTAAIRYIVIHYPGEVRTPTNVVSSLRGWQSYHMQTKGWNDIAYNMAVDMDGHIYTLRGFNVADGATSGYGGRSFSILAILGNTATPSAAMLTSIRNITDIVKEGAASDCIIVPHSKLRTTSCPGNKLRTWIDDGLPTEDNGIMPTFPLPAGYYFGPELPKSNAKSVSGYWLNRRRDAKGHPGLKAWQERAKHLGYPIRYVDGVYGPDTRNIAFQVQRARGLKTDGLIGIATWSALWQ